MASSEGAPRSPDVETDMETEEKPTLVSELTDVGTEIGTNVGANIQNRKKERKEERNIGGETTTVDSTPGKKRPLLLCCLPSLSRTGNA